MVFIDRSTSTTGYYAGLVRQIDHEVGCIVEALRHKGILDDTVIIFASDHGDYLGDHGLEGKASFYEAACHVPLVVRHPHLRDAAVCPNLVTLTDVTATILSLQGAAERERIVGVLHNGWMLFDGEWKLCRYAGGGVHLFNLEDDPEEQHNRTRDPGCAEILHRMDAELTTAIMGSVNQAFFPGRLHTSGHSSSLDFGRVGWERHYPMPWDKLHPGEHD